MHWLSSVSGQGVGVICFLGDLGYQYLCQSEWWRVEIEKCRQVKVAGERVFMDHVECVQENERCLDRVLEDVYYNQI